jgi:hypothetical protein
MGTLSTYSVKERLQLAALLRKLTTMHRNAHNISREFNKQYWASEISTPLEKVVAALTDAIDSIYRERERE